jgi:hypothetical protein
MCMLQLLLCCWRRMLLLLLLWSPMTWQNH